MPISPKASAIASTIRAGLETLPHDAARIAFVDAAYERLVGYRPIEDGETLQGAVALLAEAIEAHAVA